MTVPFRHRIRIIWCCGLLWASMILPVAAQTGAPLSVNTKSGFKKSNQSKVFYYDSQWWALAYRTNSNLCELWRYNGTSWASTNLAVQTGPAYNCDAVLNSAAGKLYVFSSHAATPRLHRFSYIGGTWQRDAGYPVTVSGFANPEQNNPISLVQAKNGDLWIFRINGNMLQTKRSANEGLTWSDTIRIKTGLKTANGLTDVTAFTFQNNNYVGVAYGETDVKGSKFGFFIHADGSPDHNWVNESAGLSFFNFERGNSQLCLTADTSNNVYLLTRNGNTTGSNPSNNLYKRLANGVWQKFKINTTSSRIWKSPAVAIDATHNRLYVMGINTATLFGEYKTCLLGEESSLDTTAVSPLLSAAGKVFDDLSVPAANVEAIRGLMVCGDNTTASDIWFQHLQTDSIAPITVGAITLSSNEVNAKAAYTIPLTLGSDGALNAGSGTIHFRFPGTTGVPNNISPSQVLINGTPCTAVVSNYVTRQVSLPVPQNLSNGQSFSVVFNIAAGLLNPTIPSSGNNHRLTVWTSRQPVQVDSPKYTLVAATTTVTPATLNLANNLVSACSTYTVAFNLGARGRLLSGSSTITLTFNAATTIANGVLSGVKVNNVAAAATGDNTTKTVTITLPATVALGNNAAVNISLPNPIVYNPAAVGAYTITVKTSVETAPVVSNNYYIADPLIVGSVLVAPQQVSAPASYAIPLTLANLGALVAGVDEIAFAFPAGTTVPSSIPANQILVDGTAATTITTNTAAREVHIKTPVNLANNAHFDVVFKTGAGLSNPPSAGNYSLRAWTSVQSFPIAAPLYAISADSGQAISTNTKSGYKKSNQSKVFYHGNQWWAIAFSASDNRWYIWKYDGVTWVRSTSLDKGGNFQWDAVLYAAADKLFLLGSNTGTTEFRRYSYAAGSWNKDSGYPVSLPDFVSTDLSNPSSLVRAKNGMLWIFRVSGHTLQGKRSADGGFTWTAPVTIKTGLTTATGTTDAVAFTSNARNFVGVAYGEPDTPAPISKFGFLKHRDSDADSVWSEESSALTFFGGERAHNALCMTTDQNDNVYLFTRTIPVAADEARNILYKRSNGGVWTKHKVNATAAMNWKTPALSIDADNGVIYALGVNLNTSLPEYKIGLVGQENALENAPVYAIFAGAAASFDDISVPAMNAGGVSGLMITIDNATADDIWFRHLAVAGNMPAGIGSVTVNSNEVNANAIYTIPLLLSPSGGLGAGTGVINFIFPDNTLVPNAIPAGAVTVNGTPVAAGKIIANSTTRQVSLTTPVEVAGSDTAVVVFNLAAGLLNPSAVGNYQMTVWTSSQPTQISSPSYSLIPATTLLTPATVALLPSDADSAADYTLNLNLGAHGRLLPGLSQFVVKFGVKTLITPGVLNGVKVNTVNAAATGDSALHKITVTVPNTVSLSNNAATTLYLPKSAIRNPAAAGNYTLNVSTSVETTPVASNPYMIQPFTGIGRPIAGTTEKFDRNNQSKQFYHAGFWWVTAQSKVDQKWYLWKFNGTAWSQDILIHDTGKNRPDCVLEPSNNRVYVLLPGSSTTFITRLKYANSAWTVDSGYPYVIPDFAQISDRGINLVRAATSDLWVFMITDSVLYGKKSSDAGKTWSAAKIALKRHLNNKNGLTDGVAFTQGNNGYIGVGYAEDNTPGSVYGFLRHRNTDPDTVWVDETSQMTQFLGTTSDDHLSMAVHNSVIYMIVKTKGGGPTVTSIGLLRREANGTWFQDPIQLAGGWTRPALAVDATNNMIYAIGTREGNLKVGELKKVAIGSYGDFVTAPVDTIFKYNTDSFVDVSVAAHTVTSAMNLLICAANDTRDEVWYHLLTLGAAKAGATTSNEVAAAEDFDGVQVYPNPFNPQTSFRFKVKETAPVKLQIFNLNGQLVRTLIDAEMPPGVQQKRWNGRSQNGAPAASGVYWYRLQIGEKLLHGRIQLVK